MILLVHNERMNDTTRGVALVIGSCISLQLGAALAISLFPTLGVGTTMLLRLGIASACLLVVVRPRLRGYNLAQWRIMGAYGVSLGVMNSLFYASIARIPLGTAVTIEFIGPLVLAAVLSRRLRDLLWVALAMLGIGMLGLESLHGATLDPLGVAFALGAGVCWAAYILTSARVGKQVDGSSGLAIGMLVAALTTIPLGIGGLPNLTWSTACTAVLAAILASVLPYSFEFAALRRLPEAVFGILLSLEPAFAATFGWLLLDQPITAPTALAVVAVVAASVGTTLNAAKAAPETVVVSDAAQISNSTTARDAAHDLAHDGDHGATQNAAPESEQHGR